MAENDPRTQALRRLGARKIDGRPVLAWVSRHRVAILIAAGVLVRLAAYLADRALWFDEQSVRRNLETKSLRGMFGPLLNSQLAPPGFLVLEWCAVRIGGVRPLVLRVVPFIGGIVSLFLFAQLARRTLRPRAVWIAVALFVVSDDLIYFATELKQYSTDVTVALVCLLAGVALSERPLGLRRFVALSALGIAAPWFSHPSAFVLAGIGSGQLLTALARRQWNRAGLVTLAGVLWIASLAGLYLVSLNQLGHQRGMWVFWNFAFPPMPPSSLRDALWPVSRGVYLFFNPYDFRTPLGPRLSASLGFAFFLTGCGSLWRRGSRETLWLLLAPVLFALLAAYLRLYPFHGRLLLFLVPSLVLLVAEGLDRMSEILGSGYTRVVFLGIVFVLPVAQAIEAVFIPRQRIETNEHGDRRPSRLEPSKFPF
jgi:hypothetical protein